MYYDELLAVAAHVTAEIPSAVTPKFPCGALAVTEVELHLAQCPHCTGIFQIEVTARAWELLARLLEPRELRELSEQGFFDLHSERTGWHYRIFAQGVICRSSDTLRWSNGCIHVDYYPLGYPAMHRRAYFTFPPADAVAMLYLLARFDEVRLLNTAHWDQT